MRCFFRPTADQHHLRRHDDIYENFRNFPYPLNFEIPREPPEVGKKNSALTFIKHQDIKKLSLALSYTYRSGWLYNA